MAMKELDNSAKEALMDKWEYYKIEDLGGIQRQVKGGPVRCFEHVGAHRATLFM